MAQASATTRIILSASFFFLLLFLPLSFLSSHHVVAAASPPISFSFDFSDDTSMYSLENLRFEGDAALKRDFVDLTCNPATNGCIGRMSYNHPVALYDSNTGEVASFVTIFTFAIKLIPNSTSKGDGMAFFLSGYPSSLPPESHNYRLGLTNSSGTAAASGAARFLAVEFDTFPNPPWDPTGVTDHMGIDLNSVASISTTRLPSYSLNGTMTATITFDSATRTLEATLNFDSNSSLDGAQVKTQLSDDLAALLPPDVAVGFSAATGGGFELHRIQAWSFSSTMPARGTTRGPSDVDVKVFQGRGLVIGGLVILALALLLAIWLTLSWYRLKRKRDSFGKVSRLKRLEYNDLSTATGKFSKKNEIGSGGFGVVYRGTLGKKEVAVKKIIKDSSQGQFKDFLAELGTIGETGHMNVVRLEGWCCIISNLMFWCLYRQKVQLFIVYELVPNGNLHEHLYDRTEVLSWEKRYKIVKGLCSALNYLHHQCGRYILHRDIKPKNILLDDQFNAKLGDFGLSRAAEHNDLTSVQTEAAIGTRSYMDPLTMKDGHSKLRRSSDVYSFGIVLLEIAHGENKLDHVRKLHSDRPGTFVEDVADEKLAGRFDMEQMERVIVLGLRCSEADASRRPSLDRATLQFLENGGELRSATVHQDETRPVPVPA